MEIPKIKQLTGNTFELPSRGWLPVHYFDAFNLLYKFENFVRLFLYVALKLEYGGNWANTNIRQDNEGTISSIFKRRRADLEKYGHIGKLSNIPLLYLTLDEIVSIILSEASKKVFRPVFPASLESVYKEKFWEVITLRNNLVHFRKFSESDLERLINNLKDLAPPMGNFFDTIYSNCENIVPCEKDDWYTGWMALFLKPKIRSKLDILSNRKTFILDLTVTTLEKENESQGFLYFNFNFERAIDSLKEVISHSLWFYKGVLAGGPIDDRKDPSVSAKNLSVRFSFNYFMSQYAVIFSLFDELIDSIENEFHRSMNEGGSLGKKSFRYLEHRLKDWDGECSSKRIDCSEDWSGLAFDVPFNPLEADSPWAEQTYPYDLLY